MRTDQGFLVPADISGFPAFVTPTEILHGAEVTGLLLETVMHRLSPPLEIQELEGDAVFAIGPDSMAAGDGVSVAAERAFSAFRRQQGELARDHSCRCGACRSVPDLG